MYTIRCTLLSGNHEAFMHMKYLGSIIKNWVETVAKLLSIGYIRPYLDTTNDNRTCEHPSWASIYCNKSISDGRDVFNVQKN